MADAGGRDGALDHESFQNGANQVDRKGLSSGATMPVKKSGVSIGAPEM